MQKVRQSELASVQTIVKIERRVSLEKPDVPVETVGANRRPKSGREESVKASSGRAGVVAVVSA
jgi:hypothetical protein